MNEYEIYLHMKMISKMLQQRRLPNLICDNV